MIVMVCVWVSARGIIRGDSTYMQEFRQGNSWKGDGKNMEEMGGSLGYV